MAKATAHSIVVMVGGAVLILTFFLIFLLIFFLCKPWRLFSRSLHRLRIIKADDIERPLVSEDHNQNNEFSRNHSQEGVHNQIQGGYSSPRAHGLAHKPSLPPIAPKLTYGESFILDISKSAEDIVVGETTKRPLVTDQSAEKQRHGRKEDFNYDTKVNLVNDNLRESVPKATSDHRSILKLEVISGPSRGLHCSRESTNPSKLPVILGRISPCDLVVMDAEVSGKHALINWNLNKLKWELVDMGSLNGTLINSKPVNHLDSGCRQWGFPVELASGDIITLGSSSEIFVEISSQTKGPTPFGVGVALDPMALRRGGNKLPMEDVCYFQWPLPGSHQFGLFGICDGHGGAGAATSVSKIMPEIVASILSNSFRRDRVLSQCDASDVLREAFLQTESCINHYYEGCTATVLLIWTVGSDFFAQCANVGDSACVLNLDGKTIKMTEDHRITSHSERLRIQSTGEPLKEGETRLCGLNLARMLGDKFLKQQEARFSSEPYISQVVYIHQASRGFAILASDGFWDVINSKKAVHLVNQTRERHATSKDDSAEKVADCLLSEARTQRTKDNTSIIFLDFDINNRSYSCKQDP